MPKSISWLLPLICLSAVSCRQFKKTEAEDTAFWNKTLLDSSYKLLYEESDTTKALLYFDSVLNRSEQTSVYPKGARFRLLANYYYFFTPDNVATATMIDSALAVYPTTELQNHYPQTYVSLLLFGGQIAYRLNQYNKANEYYFRAKKIADEYLKPCERSAYNYSIAMVLYRQQNFQASLNYFKEAYNLQELCQPATTAIALQQQEIQSNIGLCFTQVKCYDSAMHHFNKALLIARQYKDSLGPVTMDKIAGVIYGNKAKVSMAKMRLKEAEELSLKSIALNDREGYEIENAQGVKLQLAEIYRRKQDFKAMFGVLSGIRSRVQNSKPRHLMEWRRLMASYYEQNSQPDSAISFMRSYLFLEDSISDVQQHLTSADIARQIKVKEQALEISMLRKDKQMTIFSLWAAIIFAVMAMAIVFLIYQYYRRSKKSLVTSLALNEEIKKQKSAREEEVSKRHKLITEAVIEAQENERSLIGLELHDNINQVLTTVKLHNEMVMEGVGDPKVLLPRTLKYLQDCITEIRSLSKRLSAPTLGKISIEDSVKDLIDSINLTSKVKISRHISGFDQQLLKKDLHIGVYRILQEQLNNVLKHAEASEVLVMLERKEENIHLCIKDNGKGFLVSSRSSGIGLMNIQTRAENLNGKFLLKSRPGEGCQVEVIIPYPSGPKPELFQ